MLDVSTAVVLCDLDGSSNSMSRFGRLSVGVSCDCLQKYRPRLGVNEALAQSTHSICFFVPFLLQLFLDDPAAKIYLLDNFATEKECKALTDHATPHLQVTTYPCSL